MALRPQTLPSLKRQPLPAGEDPRALFNEGMAWLRQLSGAQWSDHNIHDPGVTTLEMLSLALAEQGLRASSEVLTWLTEPADPATLAVPDVGQQFFDPRVVLPNRPWTALDWRRLLIDLAGVRNAWIEPAAAAFPLYADLIRRELATSPPEHGQYRQVDIQGLYRVRIDLMDDVTTQAQRKAVLEDVRDALQRHRNLCEDFLDPQVVATQDFALCAEVDLDVQADVAEAAARLIMAADQALCPLVPSRSLAEMLQRRGPDGVARGDDSPWRIEQLFEGPLLSNGFIDDADLAASELPDSIRLSDLMGQLMDVPGVHAITRLTLNPLDEHGFPQTVANPWQAPVQAGCRPRLALPRGDSAGPTAGRLAFRKRGVAVAAWNFNELPTAVQQRLAALREAQRQRVETPQAERPSVPRGRPQDLSAHASVQRDFPALYGLGPTGLPARADDLRRAQQLQWRAYLTVFDQLIANDLAQLVNARRLLTVEAQALQTEAERWRDARPEDQPRTTHTLAAQALTDPLLPLGQLVAQGAQALNAPAVQDLVEPFDDALRRRHAQADHLLARLGDDFSAYSAIMASVFGDTRQQVLADKLDHLALAPHLSAHRAGAYLQQPLHDPQAPMHTVWNSLNISGLEQRIASLLGIQDMSRRNLATVSYDAYPELDHTPDNEYRFRIVHAITDKILLSSTTHFATPEEARQQMIAAVAAGQDLAHYRWHLGTASGKGKSKNPQWYFRIVSPTNEQQVLGRRIEGFATEEEALAAMHALRDYLREHYSGEGLYVVEGLLLRPRVATDPLTPVCVDPECPDCLDTDPYSWRLYFVLPAYAGRFQDMRFRDFAERVIRAEVPAHVLPRVCWVDSDDMAAFEGAWRDWITVHAGLARADQGERAAKLGRLIDVLARIKSIYPQRTLYECSAADTPQEPFTLGRTALGRAGTQRVIAERSVPGTTPGVTPSNDPKEPDHG